MPITSTKKIALEDLREKWQEIPIGLSRAHSSDLFKLSDENLAAVLADHAKSRDESSAIGWYFPIYRDAFRGKRILEIGSGLGLDGVTFLKAGAHWTFSDISEKNLALVKRHVEVSGADQSKADYFYIDSYDSFLRLPAHFDFIWADGSLLHLPFDDVRMECLAILSRLKEGGRWIELTYPKQRWLREGSPPFEKWGEITDGVGTPWAEWYDADKLHRRLAPGKLRTLFSHEYYNNALNWHDLQLIEKFEYSSSSSAERKYAPIALDGTVSCNDCLVANSADGIHVTTPEGMWSYAAFLPTRPTGHAEIECTVVSGSIGFGFVDEKLQFLGSECIVDQGVETTRSIQVNDGNSVAGIIFRNTFGGGQSILHLRSVRTTETQ